MDCCGAEPLLDSAMDDALKPTPVDRELRHIVVSVDAAGFAPDLLTVAIEVIELVGADRDVVEFLKQTEVASSRIACGNVLMPTPSSRIVSACSKISQSRPRERSINAVVRPPIPPPTIIAFIALTPLNT